MAVKDIGGSSYAKASADAVLRRCPHENIGGYCGGVPPLPIPNREVKPSSADGTTQVGE